MVKRKKTAVSKKGVKKVIIRGGYGEKKAAILRLKKKHPEYTSDDLAFRCSCDRSYVNKVLRDAVPAPTPIRKELPPHKNPKVRDCRRVTLSQRHLRKLRTPKYARWRKRSDALRITYGS